MKSQINVAHPNTVGELVCRGLSFGQLFEAPSYCNHAYHIRTLVAEAGISVMEK